MSLGDGEFYTFNCWLTKDEEGHGWSKFFTNVSPSFQSTENFLNSLQSISGGDSWIALALSN
ncbi:predicted protein [Sclerotinia sclerotiorum 1980 UF-70]|uniref:Uncharacterized protein n=1 Tax=Sclerotinia sclerotiorum (strain ATCC 18683 / 1980 / Ss-1) TaxID=665079 RepID=A7EAF9_SCLS1|nr:predicted protein [Sclerotinia sclerotiorum 1980 UF-70]EDN99437.1 predicted protein [Sclerotinia sclerotiorum 1980 UF-70]